MIMEISPRDYQGPYVQMDSTGDHVRECLDLRRILHLILVDHDFSNFYSIKKCPATFCDLSRYRQCEIIKNPTEINSKTPVQVFRPFRLQGGGLINV